MGSRVHPALSDPREASDLHLLRPCEPVWSVNFGLEIQRSARVVNFFLFPSHLSRKKCLVQEHSLTEQLLPCLARRAAATLPPRLHCAQ